MSPRARKARKKTAYDDDFEYDPSAGDVGGEAGPVEEDNYAPPRKKVKGKSTAKKGKDAATPRTGRKGKLAAFQTVPLDVLALIMSELDTKTLLAMSRTCSVARQLLHSTQGISCWEAARRNTGGIPDVKVEMPEWELAALLFDSSCHVCHKPRATTVNYTIKKIYAPLHSKTLECVPEHLWGGWGYGDPMKFYWVPTLKAVSARLTELEKNKDKSEYEAYLKKRQFVHKHGRADGQALERWEQRYKMDVRFEKVDAIFDRQRKIKEKLKELGYTAAELNDADFLAHNLLNVKSKLTDRAWTSAKRKLSLKPWYNALHLSITSGEERCLLPPFGNFLMFAVVRPIWEPEDAKPTQDDFNAARSAIVVDAGKFGKQIKAAFFKHLGEAYASLAEIGASAPTHDIEQLSTLVTSAIKCPKPYCSTYVTFPTILDHFKVCCTSSLTADSLTTSPVRISAIRHILEAINTKTPAEGEEGKKANEETTTTSELVQVRRLPAEDYGRRGDVVERVQYGDELQVEHIISKYNTPYVAGKVVLPDLEYTPPEPLAEEPANPGGFVVEDEAA
ncbi:hypothetical protein JCM8547_000972 [Rhodosporidiobolus lusitaniae]